MKKVIFTVALLLCGCKRESTVAQLPTAITQQAPQPDTRLTEVEWNSEYIRVTSVFTVRTYQCITEMYSLAYKPVNAGPVCRDACDLFHQVNALVDKSPFVDAEKYRLESAGGVCMRRRAKEQKKPRP